MLPCSHQSVRAGSITWVSWGRTAAVLTASFIPNWKRSRLTRRTRNAYRQAHHDLNETLRMNRNLRRRRVLLFLA
jgi:hypothetical protein